ncbi:MAG: hypothetical protein K1X89_28895, partial [Myxococcaceae bacterium]|nr:hypothetical protein [Myxococcaceae bacterium]
MARSHLRVIGPGETDPFGAVTDAPHFHAAEVETVVGPELKNPFEALLAEAKAAPAQPPPLPRPAPRAPSPSPAEAFPRRRADAPAREAAAATVDVPLAPP